MFFLISICVYFYGAKRARRGGPKEAGVLIAAGREAARRDIAGALDSDDDSTEPLPAPIEANLDEVSDSSDNEDTMNRRGPGENL